MDTISFQSITSQFAGITGEKIGMTIERGSRTEQQKEDDDQLAGWVNIITYFANAALLATSGERGRGRRALEFLFKRRILS